MPGLMDPGMLDQQGAPPPAAAPPEQPAPDEEQGETVPDDEGAEQATPEEQASYEEFVKAGFGFMYKGGKINPNILKMLDDDPSDLMSVLQSSDELKEFSPIVALAATATIITLKACEETGEKDGTIIMHGGKAILEDLVEIAGKAGVKDYSQDDMANAFRMGADLFREAAAEKGIVDLDQAKQEWGEIQTADKEGQLGKVLPQLADAKVAEAPEQEAQPEEMPGG